MDFRNRLCGELAKHELSTKEVYALFPDMNPSTVSWHLHDELKRGNIYRTSHGKYCLASDLTYIDSRFEFISDSCKKAYEYLEKLKYPFYVTGLDCMNGIGMTVNGSYPVMLCTNKKYAKDIQLDLMREFDLAVTEDELSSTNFDKLKSKIQFIILNSRDFSLQDNGFAFKEKAFVDLYYSCTRLEYPLPKNELPHILSIIEPNGFRFRRATKDRGLSDELNFLLCYDKEFISSFAEYLN